MVDWKKTKRRRNEQKGQPEKASVGKGKRKARLTELVEKGNELDWMGIRAISTVNVLDRVAHVCGR